MVSPDGHQQPQNLEDEVAKLRKELEVAQAEIATLSRKSRAPSPTNLSSSLLSSSPSAGAQHFLLLLSDSALPLGSFAFSSGLESYLAHSRLSLFPQSSSPLHPHRSPQLPIPSSFPTFLTLSLSSFSRTTLPFVLASHRCPSSLITIDDALDASVMCTVGRRASIAQGRALLGIWERSFRDVVPEGTDEELVGLLGEFARLAKSSASSSPSPLPSPNLPQASAHLAPLFGVLSRLFGLSAQDTAYIFLLSHVKALLSAAVRASMFGPYQAQKILAGLEVQEGIWKAVRREWETRVEDAGQVVPVLDLWVGRHEMLYSRIFNS